MRRARTRLLFAAGFGLFGLIGLASAAAAAPGPSGPPDAGGAMTPPVPRAGISIEQGPTDPVPTNPAPTDSAPTGVVSTETPQPSPPVEPTTPGPTVTPAPTPDPTVTDPPGPTSTAGSVPSAAATTDPPTPVPIPVGGAAVIRDRGPDPGSQPYLDPPPTNSPQAVAAAPVAPHNPYATTLVIAGLAGLVISAIGLVTIGIRRRQW
jgi:hypothetical protein